MNFIFPESHNKISNNHLPATSLNPLWCMQLSGSAAQCSILFPILLSLEKAHIPKVGYKLLLTLHKKTDVSMMFQVTQVCMPYVFCSSIGTRLMLDSMPLFMQA